MLKKQYVKSRDVCKVTFQLAFSELPEDIAVKTVSLVANFNEWNGNSHPMKCSKQKKAYWATVDLEPNTQYEFRYLLNGTAYCNDWEADGYVSNERGSSNCLVTT